MSGEDDRMCPSAVIGMDIEIMFDRVVRAGFNDQRGGRDSGKMIVGISSAKAIQDIVAYVPKEREIAIIP